MRIIGCVNGNNPDDKRCTDHVDFVNTGRSIWEGEDFDCTYCGQEWRKGPCTCDTDHTACVRHDHDRCYGTPDVCEICTPVPASEFAPEPTKIPAGIAGRWTVYRAGGLWDSMTGYGHAWAYGTAAWLSNDVPWMAGRIMKVTCIPADGSETRTHEWTV
jgi:hypothetical protein